MGHRDHSPKQPTGTSTSRTSQEKPVSNTASSLGCFYALQPAIQKPSLKTLTSNDILQLQRTIGNASVRRLLSGSASHSMEQAADDLLNVHQLEVNLLGRRDRQESTRGVQLNSRDRGAEEKVRLNAHATIQRTIKFGNDSYGTDEYDELLDVLDAYDRDFVDAIRRDENLQTALKQMLAHSADNEHTYELNLNDVARLKSDVEAKAKDASPTEEPEEKIAAVEGWEQAALLEGAWANLANAMAQSWWGGRGGETKQGEGDGGNFQFGNALKNPDALWLDLMKGLWKELGTGAVFIDANSLQPSMTPEVLNVAKEELKAAFANIDAAMDSDDSEPWTAVSPGEAGMAQDVYAKYKKQFADDIRLVVNNLVAFAEKNKPAAKEGDKGENTLLGNLKTQTDGELRAWLKEQAAVSGKNGFIEWYALADADDVETLMEIVVGGAKESQEPEPLDKLPIGELIRYFNQTAASGHDIKPEKAQKIADELNSLEKIQETALPEAFETYKMIMHDLGNPPEDGNLIMVFHSLAVSSGLSGQTFEKSDREGVTRESTRIYINVRQVMEKIKDRTDDVKAKKLKLATGTIIHEIAHAYGHDAESGKHKHAYTGVETPGGHAGIKEQFTSGNKKRWFVDPDIVAAMWLRGIDKLKELLTN